MAPDLYPAQGGRDLVTGLAPGRPGAARRAARAPGIVLGLAMILGHNLLDGLAPGDFGRVAGLWTVLHGTG